MNPFHVNREAIDRCMRHMMSAANQGNYEVHEVLLANAEMLGRIIVDTCDTPVSAIQMATVMEGHIKRTLQAGFSAKGYQMGAMDL